MPLKVESLNEGDVFVLDAGMTIYYWAGVDANEREKLKDLEIAVSIKNNERKSKAKLYYPRDAGGEIEEEFWNFFGGKPSKINPAVSDEQPSGTEEQLTKYALFHISDATGSLVTTEITERPLKREHLNDNDSYLLELYD